MFVLGCPNLLLVTDHKPLVPILNGRKLELIKNPRLLKFRERMLRYRFVAQHIPGPLNIVADAASRYPSSEQGRQFLTAIASVITTEDTPDDDARMLDLAMVNSIKAEDDNVVSWNRVREAAAKDDTCKILCDTIENGFPHRKSDVGDCLKPYHKLKDDLYTLEGVPYQ